MLFVCENNLYGEYTALHLTTPIDRLADRAVSLRHPRRGGRRKRCQCRLRTVRKAADRARAGDGPTLIEALTYRHKGHSRADPAAIAPKEEVEEWLARDPIHLAEVRPARAGRRSGRVWTSCTATPRSASAGASERAQAWDEPDVESRLRGRVGMTEVTFREAIHQALSEALEDDGRVFLLGEDIAAAGGAFKVTDGLHGRSSAATGSATRPISEQAIVGTAIGAALKGLRPVAELMFADFTGVCFDQIANQLAKYRYMTGGQARRPGDDPHGQRRRRRIWRPALPDGRELVSERPRPEDRGAGIAGGCVRSDARVDPRPRIRCCSSSTSR